jgi:TonB family protein
MMHFNLITSSLLSIGIHAAVLLLLPAPALEPLALSNTPTDTEFVVLDIPMLTALPTLPEPSALAEGRHAASTDTTYDASKIVPLAPEQLEGAIAGMSAGVPAQPPLPDLQLPALRGPETGPELPPSLPPDLAAVTASILEQSLQSPGIRGGEEQPVAREEVRLGEKQIPSRLGLPSIDQRRIARTLPETPSARPTVPPPQFGIQGPAARREPLYRPTLPEVQVQAESEITLKFWIRPDGVVSRVLPERKGDATLEVAAIRYLEGWRFTPLPPHEPQVEQWGTITIRFLLRAR